MAPEQDAQWPLDLTIFACVMMAWAAGFVILALAHSAALIPLYALHSINAGVFLRGAEARIAILVEAAVLALCAMLILRRRRWGLVIAMLYLVEVIVSRGAYAIANLNLPQQNMHVREAALEGPLLVIVLLYLWIRSKPLLFDEPSRGVNSETKSAAD